MGFLVNGQCFADYGQAQDFFMSSTGLTLTPTDGGLDYFWRDANGGWFKVHNGVNQYPVGLPFQIPCDPHDPLFSNAIPSAETLAQVFSTAFVLVMTAYVAAYLLGRLVAFFNRD